MNRPTNAWGAGDLPAPYAEGDIIDVPAGAKALERMHGMPPGRYKVVYATSIDEGDAWYFRLGKWLTKGHASDRLHVGFAGRSEWGPTEDVNWLEGCTLIRTNDPEGLALRGRMLADGWTYTPPRKCKTCGQRIWTDA